MRLESEGREKTVICFGGFRCSHYRECEDPNRCPLGRGTQENMAENKEKEKSE